MIDYSVVDDTWALFLDRDGVILEETKGEYICSPDEVRLMDGVGEALAALTPRFYKTIIVTNQKCIGRGIISENEFHAVQAETQKQLQAYGVRIDRYYFAPGLDSSDPLRKPNNGMALKAQEDFPDIDFNKSIMVGNNMSDMEFGKSVGMKTVFLSTTEPLYSNLSDIPIDEQYKNVDDWYDHIKFRLA